MCAEAICWVNGLIGLEWLLMSGLTRKYNENSHWPKSWPMMSVFFFFFLITQVIVVLHACRNKQIVSLTIKQNKGTNIRFLKSTK